MDTNYDVIIIGAGAAGLFTAISSSKNIKKLLLEKNKNPGAKVLLSGGERANISNINIQLEKDYFGQNKKALFSFFKNFNNYDLISFFEENGIQIIEEDRGRLILKSGNSRELLEFLLKKSKENNTKIFLEQSVIDIKKTGEIFEVFTRGKKYTANKVVITSGGKSFFQVGTTGDGYIFAKNFGHSIFAPHRGLCGLVTKKDLSEISGISLDLHLKIFSKFSEKIIYEEFGPFLFTHFGVSGPIVFNASVALGGYINSLVLDDFIEQFDISKMGENEKNDFVERMFLQKNIVLQLTFGNLEKIPKRIIKFFELTSEKNEISLELQDYRSWKEAKITGGGIKIDELTHHLESKFIPGLYFAGEVLDITGKTGGFNLQFAWTSGFVVGKNL